MILISTVKNALQAIREDLLTLADTTKTIYDSQPLLDIIQRVVDIVEKNGIPEIKADEVNATTHVTSEYFNNFTESVSRTILTISRCIEELVANTNTIANKFNDKFNTLEPIIKNLRTRMADIEEQVLKNATNTSIADQEIKVIDFSKNIRFNGFKVSLINNSLMLPVKTQNEIEVNDQSISIIESQLAQNRLGIEINSTEEKSDEQTIQGTYLGNIVGRLDGSEDFKSELDLSMKSLYTNDINDSFDISYYSINRRDKISFLIEHIFLSPKTFNLVVINSNVSAIAKIINEGSGTSVQLKQGVWPILSTAKSITTTFVQDKAVNLNYQGIDIIDRNTGAIVKKHNYFTSFNYLYPDTLKELNDSIKTSDLEIGSNHDVKIVDRSNFYKYLISIDSIKLYLNEYDLEGSWTSGPISTNFIIEAIDFETDQFIPDENIEYLRYQISFDASNWIDIKPFNEGITAFNIGRPSRIVIGESNTNPDYVYIPRNAFIGKRFYLKVILASDITTKTPVLYNLKVRVKVDKDAEQ